VAPAVKLLFDSLDALLGELRDRKAEIVRVSPALELDRGPRTAGVPQLVGRVPVTAALDDHHWVEWRYWVGRGVADVTPSGFQLPAVLQAKCDRALAEVARRVDEAGFQIRQGILTHDQGVLDTFRL
jgi:hypothetical protein